MIDRKYDVGYGKPPKDTRFKKGQSGNPRGRPKGAKNFSTLLDKELNERIMVTEGGRKRSLSKGAAFIKRLATDALSGKPGAQRLLLEHWPQLDAAAPDADTADPNETPLNEVDRQVLDAFKRALLESSDAADETKNESEDAVPEPEPEPKGRVRQRSRCSQPKG